MNKKKKNSVLKILHIDGNYLVTAPGFCFISRRATPILPRSYCYIRIKMFNFVDFQGLH